MVGQTFYNIWHHTLVDMDWNFGFYWWYFTDISDIGRPQNDFEYRLSNGRNIEKNIKKYQRYIGLESINRQ